ncbi:MAG TPA: HDOD domain-containing protein [Leptospiraceae bacterium]|nr:HDOD domain-containing protein [Leptospiraceae bacterium]HMX35200.1 HDOD domain-containing protein [Leptospiraceae bacterium]HMY34173.1 HDOD domain-containing protein [Leptospiraceae bacterium]HMZ64074.1 HDOD domain-containing protein [Leptospiraceae bacterium]HNA08816.1 HDOD domain-containing protein [Leptospiraceae bacterium]
MLGSNLAKLPLGVNLTTREPYNVFIVEDSVLFRTALKRTLAKLSFSVIGEAGDGLHALNQLKEMHIKPDIICVDQEMPVMNGMETIKEVKNLYPKMKIMLITSHNEGAFVKQVLQVGVHGYIVKPFETDTIIRKFSVILGRRDILGSFDEKIEKIDLSKIRLPNLPLVFASVVNFDVDDPKNGVAELEKIISPDIAMTSTIIRSANSAYYGRSGSIRNLKDAITLIGTKITRRMVINEFDKTLTNPLKDPVFVKYLRELPVLTSLISYDLLTPLNLKTLAADIFVVSLLRKIGMNILALNFVEKYLKVLRLYEFGVKSLYDLERDEIGIDSIEIGARAFEIWKMPSHFVKVIAHQGFNKEELEVVSDIDRVSRLAEILAKQMRKIAVTDREKELAPLILQYHKAPANTIDLFGEDYLNMIEDHPFMRIANG